MKNILKHAGEFIRALTNRHYEFTGDGGLLLPRQNLLFHGVLEARLNDGPWEAMHNLVVDQGILYLLGAGLRASPAAIGAWYFAPFAANVTPVNTLTAANFTSTQTEFTSYSETTRQVCTYAAPSGNAITNTASPAALTINGGGQTSMYGAGIVSSSVKSGTSGTLLACALFGTAKTGLASGDSIGLKHTLACTSS